MDSQDIQKERLCVLGPMAYLKDFDDARRCNDDDGIPVEWIRVEGIAVSDSFDIGPSAYISIIEEIAK